MKLMPEIQCPISSHVQMLPNQIKVQIDLKFNFHHTRGVGSERKQCMQPLLTLVENLKTQFPNLDLGEILLYTPSSEIPNLGLYLGMLL